MNGRIVTSDLSVGWSSDSTVLRDISLDMGAGVHCVVGPNGSGKTTLMRTLAGIIPALSGDLQVTGIVGYMSHRPGIYSQLSVEENLRQWAGILSPSDPSSFEVLIEGFRLDDIRGRSASELSQGQRQRLGLARAFLGNPDVIFIDEPTAGMDPSMKQVAHSAIEAAGEHSCVVMSSHDVLEVSGIATDIVHISASAQVTQDSAANVAASQRRAIRLAVDASQSSTAMDLLAGANPSLGSSGWITVELSPEFSLSKIVAQLESNDISIKAIDDLEGLRGYYKE